MKYKKVQFISWEVFTGPLAGKMYVGLSNQNEIDKRTDLIGQCVDIEARLKFTESAIQQAYSNADNSSDILKIFMAPEFLYRGAGGAYLHDLLNGWENDSPEEFGQLPSPYSKGWGGLLGGLSSLVLNDKFEHWLFVFGTSVSASFPSRGMNNKKFYLDPSKPGEIYNTAFIQYGGTKNADTKFAFRKHYKSGIDFIKETISSIIVHDGKVKPLDKESITPSRMGVHESGPSFQIKGMKNSSGNTINFGIEICLDHLCSGSDRENDYGRIRTHGKKVQIQLVPSGGATLKENSIWLEKEKSYAFNCDGMNGLIYGYSSHSQIWTRSGESEKKLYEASAEEDLEGTKTVKVKNEVIIYINNDEYTIKDEHLWYSGLNAKGSGHVRIVTPLPL